MGKKAYIRSTGTTIRLKKGRTESEKVLMDNAPKITMVYRDPQGELIHGFCKKPLVSLGTRQAGGDSPEDEWWCIACVERVYIPHSVYSRIAIWADGPEGYLLPPGSQRGSSRGVVHPACS